MNDATDSQQGRETWIGSVLHHSWGGRLQQLFTLPNMILLLVLAYVVALWFMFLEPHLCLPRKSIELDPEVSVWLSVTYPEYIARGDRGYIEVTACNEADRSISRSVVVDFIDGDELVCRMGALPVPRTDFQGCEGHEGLIRKRYRTVCFQSEFQSPLNNRVSLRYGRRIQPE